MSDMSQAEFLAYCVNSTAYHEAGHTTAAVLQGLALRERGIHVDCEGSGVSYYCHRSPGDRRRSTKHQLEREQTIIALYSGFAAQKKFFPECPEEEAWTSDRARICSLLEEMQPTDLAARSTAQTDLCERAKKLVTENWATISALASTLLAKQNTALPAIEVKEGWSRGKKGTEKFMSGPEVAKFFERLGIAARIVPE